MLKISDALASIINANDFLKVGLSHRLFNLSQLARYLSPLVEARLKKEVKISAILMNLSRMQSFFERGYKLTKPFCIEKISVQANLFTVTFTKNLNLHRHANNYYKWIQRYKGFISISESTKEVTLITEMSFLERLPEYIPYEHLFLKKNITGIGLQFDPSYTKIPGFLYMVLQKTTLQGVNLIEVFSTYTEFMIFVDHEDSKLAFNTLYACFRHF